MPYLIPTSAYDSFPVRMFSITTVDIRSFCTQCVPVAKGHYPIRVFSITELYRLKALYYIVSHTNICVRASAYELLPIGTNFLLYVLQRAWGPFVGIRTSSVISFLHTNLIRYYLFTLRTLAVKNFIPYELLYPARTAAYELFHVNIMLTNFWPGSRRQGH